MLIKSAIFEKSSPKFQECPKPLKPEYAFIGRSNVGKSSLINMLTGKKKLAKTSGSPGKTQLINHFLINDEWYLVDLPGYGYAKVAKTKRADWGKMIENYLEKRESLMNVFVLIDSRHEMQAIDRDFMAWMGKRGIPFAMVFTKCDKLTPNQLAKNQAAYKKAMLRDWAEMPPAFLTSSENGLGKEEVLGYISEVNKLFVKP